MAPPIPTSKEKYYHPSHPLPLSESPDIERDGHKGIENHYGGQDLEEGDLCWAVLERVVVRSIDQESSAIHTLKYQRTNQTYQHTHSQETKNLDKAFGT